MNKNTAGQTCIYIDWQAVDLLLRRDFCCRGCWMAESSQNRQL